MATTVDARGLVCPQPVILTRRALKESAEVVVIVDNDTSAQNVARMARRQGYIVAEEKRDDGTYLRLTRRNAVPAGAERTGEVPAAAEGASVAGAVPAAAVESAPGRGAGSRAPLVLLVSSEFLGRGEHEELGSVLVRSFFHTLGELDSQPDAIVFINSGVKLVVHGSPVTEDLQTLVDAGAQVYACGTCLEYYGLKERVGVGEISNMYSIASALLGAGRVVNL